MKRPRAAARSSTYSPLSCRERKPEEGGHEPGRKEALHGVERPGISSDGPQDRWVLGFEGVGKHGCELLG